MAKLPYGQLCCENVCGKNTYGRDATVKVPSNVFVGSCVNAIGSIYIEY